MSMADDYKSRSYRDDPYRRAAEPARPGAFSSGDPLSELARLIGQNDPFAEQGRAQPRDPLPRGYQPRSPEPEWPPAIPERRYAADPRDSDPRGFDPRSVDPRGFDPRSIDPRDTGREPYAPNDDYGSYSRSASREPYLPSDDYVRSRSTGREAYAPSADYAPSRDPGRYAPSRELSSEAYAPHDDYAQSLVPQAPPPRNESRWSEPESQHYADAHSVTAEQVHAHGDEQLQAGEVPAELDDEQYYQDDIALEPHEDDLYDDAPSATRRGGLATILALVGCALLGTAGAYAYRSYAVNPGDKAPPPVITADNSTPTKVVPAPTSDTRSSKQISDRFATAAAGNEQLVSRQEEPVALKEPEAAAPPRVVLPAPVQPVLPTPPAQAAQSAPPAAAQTPGGGEPRKVRTVTIRPDGSDTSGRPVSSGHTATTPPAPRATTSRAPAPPRQTSNGPLSLDPQGNDRPSRTRTATRESFSNSSASGGYVVQLSSQRTESDAHATFRSLQSKFPNELGNRQVIIRRADLGSKGIVYRSNVGPFATVQEASRFCASYKAAGGQCIVPR